MLLVILYYLSFFLLFKCFNNSSLNNNAITSQALIAFLLLFVFFGFRDLTVLNDTPHYYATLFYKMSYAKDIGWFEANSLGRYERGYQIFENFHAKLFSNPYSIIMTSSLIVTISNISLFKKLNREYLFLCLFLMLNFQLENQYSAIRQAIATALLYYGIVNLMNGGWKQFVLSVLFASTFHTTAIITLPLVVFKFIRIRFTKKKILLIIIFFFFFIEFILPHFVTFFSTDDVYMQTNADRESFPLGSLILALLNTYLLYNSYVLNKNVSYEPDYLYWILGILCVFVSYADIAFPIVGRTSMYFYPFLVSLYVKCFQQSPTAIRNRNLIVTFFLFFGWFVAYNLLRPEWYHMYPYSFIDLTKTFVDQ